MSVTELLLVIEAVVLALVVLFVVALLRSHAEILRRLASLDGAGPALSPAPGLTSTAPRLSTAANGPAPDALIGRTLAGDTVKLSLGAGSPPTLLAFLSSGCTACEPLWARLRDGSPVPSDLRLVVVTKDPEHERMGRLQTLAPAGQELVMSTEAWVAFDVPSTPHFVLIGAAGEIAGRGGAASWEQILDLLGDAGVQARHAHDSRARAARVEAALAAAGLTAGHPSLYPSGSADPSGSRR